MDVLSRQQGGQWSSLKTAAAPWRDELVVLEKLGLVERGMLWEEDWNPVDLRSQILGSNKLVWTVVVVGE